MRISVSTRHGHLAAETQEKIAQKIEKLTRFHDRISSADVTVDLKDENQPRVEVNLSVDGAPGFLSKTQGARLIGAVEGAVNKLEEQLRRHKEKTIDQHRDSSRRRPHALQGLDDGDDDGDADGYDSDTD